MKLIIGNKYKFTDVSMFNVCDKVVRLDLYTPHIYSIIRIEDCVLTIGRKVRHRTLGTWLECNDIRLAEPEEIAAGHRIDCKKFDKRVNSNETK